MRLLVIALALAACTAPAVVPPPATPTAASCTPTTSEGDATFPPTPERASVGADFALSGLVRSQAACAPLAGARVEFWLANPQGEYDDARRGWTRTGADGRYRITTTFPGSYGGVSPHIHLRFLHDAHGSVVRTIQVRAGTREGSLDIVLPTRG